MRTRAGIRLTLFLAFVLPLATAFAQEPPRPEPLVVRTFTLRHLSAEAARTLVAPYTSTPGFATVGPPGIAVITVRAQESTLTTIERILAEYDRPPATITFRFQLIVATDAPSQPDTSIARVVPLLRDLFRFGGYRLLSHAAINALAGGSSSQTVGTGADRMRLDVNVDHAEVQGTGGSVRIRVGLSRTSGTVTSTGAPRSETLLSTGLTIPLGQTVVLGSAVSELGERFPDAKALILTVQPELARIGR